MCKNVLPIFLFVLFHNYYTFKHVQTNAKKKVFVLINKKCCFFSKFWKCARLLTNARFLKFKKMSDPAFSPVPSEFGLAVYHGIYTTNFILIHTSYPSRGVVIQADFDFMNFR